MVARSDQRAAAQNRIVGSASFTEIRHRLSRRLAKARVNSSGICCTITMPGASGAELPAAPERLRSAGGRADDHHFFGGFEHRAGGPGKNGVRRELGLHHWRGRVRRRAAAAASDGLAEHHAGFFQELLVPRRGLAMISTAPYSRAFSVLCAPSSARLEQMTTGIGCWS
jgi:hypothetical protein